MSRWLTAGLGVLLLVSLAGCGGARAEKPSTTSAIPTDDLRVRRGEFVQSFLLTGELKAVRSEPILVPRSPSWQIQIRWLEEDGARVSKGQKVVELDNTALVSALQESELAEIKADDMLFQKEADLQAEHADLQFRLEQCRFELEKAELEASIPAEIRPRREHQEKQLALARARAEHEKAEVALQAFRESSGAELAILRIDLEKARREVEAAERAIDQLVLRAPREGILVIEENPREGRKFQIGDSAWVGLTVARIPDLTEMRVEAYLSDVDDGRIKVGDPAVCVLDAYPELSFDGRVEEITPIAQEVNWRSMRRSFRAILSLGRTDPERMRPGMSVRLDIEAARLADTLLAPRAAVDLTTEPPRVFLRSGRAVEARIGACNALECIVEEGLSEGDRLGRRG